MIYCVSDYKYHSYGKYILPCVVMENERCRDMKRLVETCIYNYNLQKEIVRLLQLNLHHRTQQYQVTGTQLDEEENKLAAMFGQIFSLAPVCHLNCVSMCLTCQEVNKVKAEFELNET